MRKLFLLGLLLLGAVDPALAAPDGRQLYVQFCSACHQMDGAGGIGLPLVATKLDDVSDEYLTKTIRLGRPGRIMPAFREMSDAQVAAIVRYLRQHTETQEKVFDSAPLAGDVTRGRKLFETHCVSCHGKDGAGAGKGTGVTLSRERSFLVMPAAISNAGFQTSATDQMIKHIIQVGRVQSAMPSFSRLGLKDQDFNDLVVYVRELGKQAVSKGIEDNVKESPTHVIESPYDFETTVANLKQALVGSNFRTFPDRFLEQGLIDEFSVNKRQIGIRFCNFSVLYGMLKIEPRLGVVLPCRVTVMERKDGTVLLVVPNLRVVSRWFNNAELVGLWDEMEETFNEILEEVTL